MYIQKAGEENAYEDTKPQKRSDKKIVRVQCHVNVWPPGFC